MTQVEKLYAKLVTNRAAMRFRDFQRILLAFGFTYEGTKGSHHKNDHPKVPRPMSIQPKGNLAKPYQIDQFLDMVEEFGLEIDK